MDEFTSAMDKVGISLMAMTVESRIVVRHRGMRPAGVDGRQLDKIMRSLSGWIVRERLRVGWFPLTGIVISVEFLNGLVESTKLLGGPVVVWWTAGVVLSMSSGMRCGTGQVVLMGVVGVQGDETEADGVSGCVVWVGSGGGCPFGQSG